MARAADQRGGQEADGWSRSRATRRRAVAGCTSADGGHHHRERHADDAVAVAAAAVSCVDRPRRLRMNRRLAAR